MSEQDVEDGDGPADESGEEAATDPDGTLSDALADVLSGVETDGDEAGDGAYTQDLAVDAKLVDRIEQTEPEEIGRQLLGFYRRVRTLEDRLAERDEEIEDLESRLKRKQADFQNYKKRQSERLEEEKQRATEDLVERLIDVRDNLARALDQEADADIRDGVETTLRQFDEQFERENVQRLEPEPGEAVDPQRHEALATIDSDQPVDTIAKLHRPGYEMAGKVIRPAQVLVSDGPGDGEDETSGPGDCEDETSGHS